MRVLHDADSGTEGRVLMQVELSGSNEVWASAIFRETAGQMDGWMV